MMDERSTPDPVAAGRPDPPGGGSAADLPWWYRDLRQPDPPVPRDRRRWTRRERTIDALACLAVSTLCFIRARSETLFIDDWDFYHRMPLGAPILVALVLIILGLAAVGFEARPAGLELPELDRLRRESLYADAARPPAGTPEVSMPALITGRPVVAVSPVSPNDLELTFSDGKTARWSAPPNVFSRARALGYDTAVIGWHLPYPRVLGRSLGVADWRPSDAHEQARGDTFGETLQNQWASLAPPANVRRLVSQRVAELGDLAIRTAASDRFGLVLLHLPVPRPPGIYDPATGRLTAWNFTGAGGGYLDNLALADRMIAELRRGLKRARLDDRTWLVVSADRWWRASRRYDGQEDHRGPFLVRPPDGG